MRLDLLVAICAPLAVFALEIGVIGWPQSSLRKLTLGISASEGTDWLMFAIHLVNGMSILAPAFSAGLAYGLAILADRAIQSTTSHSFRLDTGLTVANIAVFVVAFSFFNYWSHRFFHAGPFWHLHKFHHSAQRMNPLVMHRAHPANLALDPLVRSLPIIFVAIPGWAITLVLSADVLLQLIVHSSLRWDWGWFGRWVLLSPAAHRVHHSTNPSHYGKNFSTSFVIWDRVFGTWSADYDAVNAVGVPGYHPKVAPVDWLRDMGSFVRAISRKQEPYVSSSVTSD